MHIKSERNRTDALVTAQDVEFLQEQGVMDYSMLVGHFSLPATTALNEIRSGPCASVALMLLDVALCYVALCYDLAVCLAIKS